jgi:ribosome-binding protein aMBF1 (putative translation factor)
MQENLKLLNAIRTKGLKQKDFARLVGDKDSMVSGVIRGRLNLDDEQKIKYARILDCKIEELFEE